MISAEAWQAFGSVLAVVVALGGGVFALQRLGIIKKSPAPTPPADAAPDGRVSDLESVRADVMGLRRRLDEADKGVACLRLHIAENYISREDWVPMTSRVIGMLEEHTAMLARLDERSRPQRET